MGNNSSILNWSSFENIDVEQLIKTTEASGFEITACELFCDKLSNYLRSGKQVSTFVHSEKAAEVAAKMIEAHITNASVCKKGCSVLTQIISTNAVLKKKFYDRVIPLMGKLMGTYSDFADTEKCISACCLCFGIDFCTHTLVPDNPHGLPLRASLLNYRKDSFVHLCNRIPNNLFVLDLSPNHIGTDGCLTLSHMMEVNKTIHFLFMSWNNISTEGCIRLAQALEKNEVLRMINLSWNHIGPAGGAAIGQMLRKNNTLQMLDLSWNSIGPLGGVNVASALRTNTALNMLNLEGNQIGPEGGIALAHALKNNTTLHLLYLLNNKIGAEGGVALAKALEKNTTLHMINLSTHKTE